MKSVDNAGNISAWTTAVQCYIDRTPPTVTVSLPTVNVSNVNSVSVTGTCSENGRSVSVNVTNPLGGFLNLPGTCSGNTYTMAPQSFATLADGTLNASATHSDAAGNVSVPATASALKDTIAPGVAGGEAITPVISALNTPIGRNYTSQGTTTNSNGPTLKLSCTNCSFNDTLAIRASLLIHHTRGLFSDNISCNDTAKVICSPATGGVDIQIMWVTNRDNNGTWTIDNALLRDTAGNVGTSTKSFTILNNAPTIQ